jgi:hypothetical protein
MEGPVAFYIRLTKLAATLRRRISIHDQLIDRLDNNWLIHAQNVWDTLKLILTSSKRKRDDQLDDEFSPRPSKQISIGRRVSREHNRRRANNLCLRCGKDDHLEPTYPDRQPVRKGDRVMQEKATQTLPEIKYSEQDLLNKGTRDQLIEIDIVKIEAYSSVNGEWRS